MQYMLHLTSSISCNIWCIEQEPLACAYASHVVSMMRHRVVSDVVRMMCHHVVMQHVLYVISHTRMCVMYASSKSRSPARGHVFIALFWHTAGLFWHTAGLFWLTAGLFWYPLVLVFVLHTTGLLWYNLAGFFWHVTGLFWYQWKGFFGHEIPGRACISTFWPFLLICPL